MTSFPEIRRQDRLLAPENMETLLSEGEYGFLAMCAANDYGYGIPMSYARKERQLYFQASSCKT